MKNILTVKVLENGGVKIPKDLRDDLQLKTGTKLLIMESKGGLYLKRIDQPGIGARFENLIKQTRQEAKKKGLTQKDLFKAIQKVRSSN